MTGSNTGPAVAGNPGPAVAGDASTWTPLTGLAEAAGTGPAEPGSRPDIALLARATGVNVLRLSFRAGPVMADHRAARPILVLGQTGEVDFAVGGDTVALRPGAAVHVEAGVTHALTAVTDAVVTLLVLDHE